MNVLVTGATGFIGRAYIRHLNQCHQDVTLFLCDKNLTKTAAMADIHNGHFFCGDLLDEDFAQMVCKGVDTIVHCPDPLSVYDDYERCYRHHVETTDLLLKAAIEAGVHRLVYVGDASIYCDYRNRLDITEACIPARFADNRCRTLFQAESRVRRAHSEQLKTVVLRPYLVIGHGYSELLSRLLLLHQQGRSVWIGEGDNLTSFVSLSNLLQALDCAVFGPEEVTGDCYNIADPEPIPIWSIVERLLQELGEPSIQRHIGYARAISSALVNDYRARLTGSQSESLLTRFNVAMLGRSFTLNIQRAHCKLGYRPQSDIDSSITAFADWWRQRNFKSTSKSAA